ncbi:hypothetical protein C1645_761488 [Glomus cerebriforme]|uniref:Uncharacterized protein n=1 Tax=Glomus cerebriforme TaxID=658196 RepID=A0A397TG74_9GLOM|nr:hypothetical protein C1645_761488 [Glomus cerebriforme]
MRPKSNQTNIVIKEIYIYLFILYFIYIYDKCDENYYYYIIFLLIIIVAKLFDEKC